MNSKITHISQGANFTAVSVGNMDALAQHGQEENSAKIFMKEEIKATGAEVSFALLPAGAKLPFSHAHKQNEEIYIIIKGQGEMEIDGQVFAVSEGSVIRVAPAGKRTLQSAPGSELIYITVQTKANSLQQWSMDDGILL